MWNKHLTRVKVLTKKPRNHLRKHRERGNTNFSQRNKMNKVVYEAEVPRTTLFPFFGGRMRERGPKRPRSRRRRRRRRRRSRMRRNLEPWRKGRGFPANSGAVCQRRKRVLPLRVVAFEGVSRHIKDKYGRASVDRKCGFSRPHQDIALFCQYLCRS